MKKAARIFRPPSGPACVLWTQHDMNHLGVFVSSSDSHQEFLAKVELEFLDFFFFKWYLYEKMNKIFRWGGGGGNNNNNKIFMDSLELISQLEV